MNSADRFISGFSHINDMSNKKHIAILSLVGIVIAAVIVSQLDNEPSYHGHRLGWWVDLYGNSHGDDVNPKDVEALTVIGTNALPYLINWIQNANAKPSHARQSASLFIERLPKFIVPDSLVSWADEKSFYAKESRRAMSAAVTFSVLGTNAYPSIPELKAILANPTNGFACVVAERALTRIGPDGFAAVLEVIANPELPQRGELMQGELLSTSLARPSEMPPGQADPNFRINSKQAAPVLLKCLEDKDSFVREWAITLLRISDPDSTVPAFTNFLQESLPPAIYHQAIESLAAYGEQAHAAVPFLLSRLHDADPDIRAETTNALMQIAPEALANGRLPQSQ
jgi:hypothetical protein